MPESPTSSRFPEGLRWMAAPFLAGLAIVVHLIIDVPRAPMIERDSPKTVGEVKKAKQAKNRSRAKRKRRGYEPRDEATRARLRRRWAKTELDDEPVDQGFRRRHEALLRSVVTRARVQALDGERAVPIQIRPSCHTIRCALELCGPQEMIDDIAALLPSVTVADAGSLWQELREVEAQAPAKDDATCRKWVVDFAVEGVQVRDLQLPE